MPCDESWIYCYDPETMRQRTQWKHAGSPRPKTDRQSKSTYKLLMIPSFDSTGMIYMHWVRTRQTVNKEYYVEVQRQFRKGFRRKRPALFKSSQWHFHQDNAPVYNSILVTDYLTKMGIEIIEEMKEALTKVTDTLTHEDFHGAFQKLLERYNNCIAAGED